MKVKDKIIVVTGGGSGIGRELVSHLLTKGARVVAVDVNRAALEETKAQWSGPPENLAVLVTDITDRAAVALLPEQVNALMGAVDGLINNAGIMHQFKKFSDLDNELIERVLNINVMGTINMTKAFLPELIKRQEAHIANLSSMAGFIPVAGQSIYCASKGAIKQLTEVLHSELSDTSVGVTVIFPGAVDTPISKTAGVEIPKTVLEQNKSYKQLSAASAAEQIIRSIENNRYRLVLGNDANFMDKLYRLNPRFAAAFLYKKMKSLLPADQ